MERLSKESPGCIHSMLKYLAELDNTSEYKTLEFKTVEEARYKGNNYNKSVIYDGITYKDPRRRQIKGGAWVIEYKCGTIFSEDIIPDKVIVKLRKTISEFTVKPEPSGEYVDCLGGGWTQKVSMYKIHDKYFAAMDCTCF